jgi:hypothetical protein
VVAEIMTTAINSHATKRLDMENGTVLFPNVDFSSSLLSLTFEQSMSDLS